MKTSLLPKKVFIFLTIILFGIILAGLTIVQAKSASISLDSPVSFPVDI